MAGSQINTRNGVNGVLFWIQALLLNLIFYPVMFLWTIFGIIVSPFCVALWALVTRWDVDRIVRHLINIHGYGLIVIVFPFIRCMGDGLKNVKSPCILVVNHLSFFDSYFISLLPFRNVIFAVGKWPFKMFWYATFMRLARYLDIESTEWEQVKKTCVDTFSHEGVVVFFPEGHRSKNRELQPFYSGAFRLAQETGIPIVPLCITGTDVMLPRDRFFLHPTKVYLKVLAPVDPSGYTGKTGLAELRGEVRTQMTECLEEMQEQV